MMELNKEKIIAGLKKQNKLENVYNLFEKGMYDPIYESYGRDTYLLFSPAKHKKQDIKKLLKRKRYATIYNKYGKTSKCVIRDVRNHEHIEQLNGAGKNGKYKLYKKKHPVISGLKNLAKVLMIAPISVVVFLGGINIYNQYVAALNHDLFLEEHLDYEQRIEDYAAEINSMELDDLQIIMKVLDDTWSMVDGYGNPKYDVYGSWRLDVTENGAVRCRNLADDFSAKMNEINPNYNARNLPVYQNAEYYRDDSFANIARKVDYSSVTDTSVEKYSDFTFQTDKDMTQYLGNHMVTILEIPNENITLVVDSLNPSIGVLKNGEIHMFSTIDGKGIEDKPLGSIIFTPMEDCFSNCISEIKSYTNDKTIEELNYKYGIKAQNEALEYIRNLESTKRR